MVAHQTDPRPAAPFPRPPALHRRGSSHRAPTPGNPLRLSLARSVLNPGDYTTPALAAVIATDPAVSDAGYTPSDPDSAQAAVSDEQILTAVRAAWNITAGVTADVLARPAH
ncbi:hypothetical protein ACFH04_07430 [Streptomyces noboritoensis]|uniref:Uncharacterized protein n=1 Tax=Streptomyces noboritoensis TaxID=67337 RepID=A0ABV6TDS0_9ACTN